MPRFFTSFKNDRQVFNTVEKRNSLSPSFLSGIKHTWRKETQKHILTLSEESGIGYRKTHLIPPTSAWILTAPVGRVWRFTHFCSVALLLEKWFTCHHSTPYFFITLFPTAFSLRSRMTGRYLIPLKNAILSRRHSWAVGRSGMMIEENIIWLLAKNPA